MQTNRGIPVSAGVAIGPVLVLDTEGYRIPSRLVRPTEVESEVARLHCALAASARETRDNQQAVDAQLGKRYGAIFAAHALFFEDPALVEEIEHLIREQQYAAEYAVSKVTRRYATAFQNLKGNLGLSSRSADVYDIERKLLSHLLGKRREDLANLTEPVILLAHDLTPSETARFDPAKIIGFATEAGGRTSHTAIIAAALELPSVVAVGDFLSDVTGGDEAIVDGNAGLLIINPDDETRRQYESSRQTYISFARQLDELRDVPAETKDGVRVELSGNIEFPSETKHALEKGACGIGLYRTEFLYLGRDTDPTEEEHYAAYVDVLRTLPPGAPLVIRTLDIGADKFSSKSAQLGEERNPVLGLRSIRLCLRHMSLFKRQIRAILRAAVHGAVQILFPMIATYRELRQCVLVLAEVKEDLQEEGVEFNPHVPVGTMIEVPSAAIIAPQLARDVDFLSIGTNDLVQYTLAADRTNENVAELYSAADPAVLHLIQRVLDAGRQCGKRVNVCGEMSGETAFATLLVGMGLRHFSVTAHHIPEIKRVIRAFSVAEAEDIAREALRLESAVEVMNFLRDQTRRLVPDAMA